MPLPGSERPFPRTRATIQLGFLGSAKTPSAASWRATVFRPLPEFTVNSYGVFGNDIGESVK